MILDELGKWSLGGFTLHGAHFGKPHCTWTLGKGLLWPQN